MKRNKYYYYYHNKPTIDETLNFWNFRTFIMDKIVAFYFLWHFGTSFLNGKNEVTGQMKQAAITVTDWLIKLRKFTQLQEETDNRNE